MVGVGLELLTIMSAICSVGAELGSGFVSGEEREMDAFVRLMIGVGA